MSGKFHDQFGNYKKTILVLYIVSTMAYLYFTFATSSILLQFFITPFWAILLMFIVGNFCLNALYPLGYLFCNLHLVVVVDKKDMKH